MAVRRWKYGMGHQWITNLAVGDVVPVFHQEVAPGDTWFGSQMGMLRAAPMEVPSFGTLNAGIHFWFVPHRILWEEFEDVITGVVEPSPWPTLVVDSLSYDNDTIFKAFGIPNPDVGGGPGSFSVNALPIRAYNRVVSEFYRDQQLDPEVSDDSTIVQRVNFTSSDYYASARDTIQQGTEEVVDVSGGTLSVTALRDAQHRQRFKERRSQYGERYTDLLLSMGLRVPDSRLDRPEHCARGRTTIGISEVVATATSQQEQTGEYRGHGIAGISVRHRPKAFLEHGTLLGLLHIRPRNQINSGLDRVWDTRSKDDLFLQELARDTQVPMHTTEVFADPALVGNIVGYQARDEWLRKPRDIIAQQMKEIENQVWTTRRDFGSPPSMKDIVNVPTYTHLFQDQGPTHVEFYAYMSNRIAARRMVPRRVR